MMKNVRMMLRRLSEWTQNETLPDSERIRSLCDFLSCQMSAKTVLLSVKGEVLFCNSTLLAENAADLYLGERLHMMNEIQENITSADLQMKSIHPNEAYSFYPLLMKNERKASLLFHKQGAFEEWELAMFEFSANLLSLLYDRQQNNQGQEESRNLATVKSAIGTLSYTELEAILRVFETLKGKDGLIVLRKVADEHNITRSIIVNAIRKLESGGLLETRSLGMKGTYIKVTNQALMMELAKLTNM